jgi:hypothetical protein
MSSDEVQAILSVARFEPLQLHLATGEVVSIDQPQSLFLRGQDLLVLHRDPSSAVRLRHFDVIAVSTIVRIETSSGARRFTTADRLPAFFAPEQAALSWFESLLSVLACTVICFRCAKLGYDLFVNNTASGLGVGDYWLIAGWSGLIAFELFVLWRVLKIYGSRSFPIALNFSLAYRTPASSVFRFAMCLVWIAHVALGMWAFAWLSMWVGIAASLWDGMTQWLVRGIRLVIMFAGAHGLMLFALLAAKCAGVSQDGLRRLWGYRLAMDVALVMAVTALERQWFSPTQFPRRGRK